MQAKVEAWCKKHAHVLVFSGAFIVFVTFVIREGFEDSWQRTAEDIDKAQYSYAVKRRLTYLVDSADTIKTKLFDTHDSKDTAAPDKDDPGGEYFLASLRYQTFINSVSDFFGRLRKERVLHNPRRFGQTHQP